MRYAFTLFLLRVYIFIIRHGLHGLHGTRPLLNEANAHLDDAESRVKSVSSNQPEATETQGYETVLIRVIRAKYLYDSKKRGPQKLREPLLFKAN